MVDWYMTQAGQYQGQSRLTLRARLMSNVLLGHVKNNEALTKILSSFGLIYHRGAAVNVVACNNCANNKNQLALPSTGAIFLSCLIIFDLTLRAIRSGISKGRTGILMLDIIKNNLTHVLGRGKCV